MHQPPDALECSAIGEIDRRTIGAGDVDVGVQVHAIEQPAVPVDGDIDAAGEVNLAIGPIVVDPEGIQISHGSIDTSNDNRVGDGRTGSKQDEQYESFGRHLI